MNKSGKGKRLFFLGLVVGIAVLLLSIFKVQATLTSGEKRHDAVETIEATSRGPNKSAVALTSDPRQVLDSSTVSSETDAAFDCGLWCCNALSTEDMNPYIGPLDCTGQSPQTITESFHNVLTFSGGRVSWWSGYQYGTVINQSFVQDCPNPPLVVQASRPMSYWRHDRVGCYDQTVTFTANTGQVITSPCTFNAATAEFVGTNITQVTITGSPNNRLYLGNVSYIEDTAPTCPTIPIVP